MIDMDEKAKARIAAIMVMLNLGHRDNFSIENAYAFPENWTGDAASDICILAAHLIENDLMEATFIEEAAYWIEQIDSFPNADAFISEFRCEEWWIKEVLSRRF